MRRLFRLLAPLALLAPLMLLAAPLASAAPTQDWTRTVSRNPAGAYVIGSPAARIKLVEWESYTCPHCAAFARESQATLTDRWIRNGEVSLEIRHLVRDSADLAAAVVARCTGARGFFATSAAIFERQDKWLDRAYQFQQGNAARLGMYPPLARLRAIADASGLSDIGRAHELSDARLDACFADQAEVDRIVAMAGAAQGVEGTPSFFVAGQRLDGFTWDKVEPLLRARVAH